MSENVYIIGVGMNRFAKHPEKSIKVLTGEALEFALEDCGISPGQIEAAWFSNSAWGLYTFQHCIRGQVALSANGLEGIPVTNVENACASASTALHGAWIAVKAGLYDCVLAIGAEKLHDADRVKVMQTFSSAMDVEEMLERVSRWQDEAKKKKEKEGNDVQQSSSEKGSHSVFMDFYASSARRHMKQYGTTQRQLAVIASKNHNNAVSNPLAQYTFPVTVEEALQDREVSYPLTRSMCAPIGDGAAAAIICSEKFVQNHGMNRAVLIRASVLKSGKREGENDVCERAAKAAYQVAGLGPEDVDVAEVHDATAFGELYQTEQLGFCPVGEGGPFAESGATSLHGRIPVNPSGGLISRGHPIGASGLAQIFELVTQLRGEAGQRQIRKHRIALAENGGGTLGNGEAAMAIHILERCQ